VEIKHPKKKDNFVKKSKSQKRVVKIQLTGVNGNNFAGQVSQCFKDFLRFSILTIMTF